MRHKQILRDFVVSEDGLLLDVTLRRYANINGLSRDIILEVLIAFAIKHDIKISCLLIKQQRTIRGISLSYFNKPNYFPLN